MATPGLHTPLGVAHVSETLGSWSQHVASWMGLAQRPVHLVRYEDMLEHPQRIFSGIVSYLNLRPTPRQLDAAIQKSSFTELAKQETERGFKERPVGVDRFFRAGKVGTWKETLSDPQVAAVHRAHGPMMQRMGYLPPTAGQLKL